MMQEARTAERHGRQSRAASRLSGLQGANASDIRSGRMRKVAEETEAASGFGQLDEDRIEKVAAIRQRMAKANCDRSKAIRSAHITDPEEVEQWEQRGMRSTSVREKFSNSALLGALDEYDF
jgi:hypothetical protein